MDNKTEKALDPLVAAIAEILDAKQHKAKISDIALAETVGLPVVSVRRYIAGTRDMPASAFVKITKALGLNSEEVVSAALRSVSE
jgi:plasmid maintenance system antidote protein VapI